MICKNCKKEKNELFIFCNYTYCYNCLFDKINNDLEYRNLAIENFILFHSNRSKKMHYSG